MDSSDGKAVELSPLDASNAAESEISAAQKEAIGYLWSGYTQLVQPIAQDVLLADWPLYEAQCKRQKGRPRLEFADDKAYLYKRLVVSHPPGEKLMISDGKSQSGRSLQVTTVSLVSIFCMIQI